ncbi:conserved Plasmodium protein, unknown function [Plasmodium gallinaceum]|uniref:Uncharacterized protein n=1 Tax=Plasmodium gallinaceum TaxID=5849 RepID=A0A1J1GR14_PLAGA|nr:conserved Plasmodium protein, unknown function [Plasmodium gallinaceum]CRG93711.1 conserved Plasmodium protein, unknown function [Plasmodium gallinaceum]
MKLFFFFFNILVFLYRINAQLSEVYDENQKSTQFHFALWTVLVLISAFILGTYATFQIAYTKDSLLYSKINTSNNGK